MKHTACNVSSPPHNSDVEGNKTSKNCAFCRIERHAQECYPESSSQRKPFLEPFGIIGKGGTPQPTCNSTTNFSAAEIS